MTRVTKIDSFKVIGRLPTKPETKGRDIYSVWARGEVRLAEVPKPWGRIDDKGRKTCCFSRSEGYTGRFYCQSAGKLHTDDRYYCGTHNPDKVRAKHDARNKAWRDKFDEGTRQRQLASKRDAFRKAAADAIMKIAAGYNDSRGLAEEVAAMNPD